MYLTFVIPGRAEGANPESRGVLNLWSPGSPLRGKPE